MNSAPDVFASTGPVPCADHPDVETRLRCSRCGKPICPRCAVRTPVGMRCPDCAGKRATVVANPAGTLKAAHAGLAVATIVGNGWLKSRRGPDLQAIAIAIVVYGLLLSRVILAQRTGIDLGHVNEFRPAIQRALYLRPIPDLLFAAISLVIAWIRFR